jgi:N-acetylglucosaminyl-diphospho-decaprenol L-rhamnosyltransferase
MDVSVVILTRNQPELLGRCLESCFCEIKRASIQGEVILIDNASIDLVSQRMAVQFPGLRVIRNEENRSFSAGNNQGIRASSARAVLLLNDDAILQQGSLVMMLQALDSDPAVGVVGPKLLNPDGSLQRGYTHRRFPRVRSLACGLLGLNRWLEKRPWTRDLLTHSLDAERGGSSQHLAGACLLLRRAALDSVDLLDEGYWYWLEDADLCYRLKLKGWRAVYMPGAHVTHYGSASLSKLLSSERRMLSVQALMYYYRRHRSVLAYASLKFVVGCVLLICTPLDVASAMRRRPSRPREWALTAGASFRNLIAVFRFEPRTER